MEADIQRDIADALESRRARPGNRGFERRGQPLAGSVDSLIGEADVARVQLASRAELTPPRAGDRPGTERRAERSPRRARSCGQSRISGMTSPSRTRWSTAGTRTLRSIPRSRPASRRGGPSSMRYLSNTGSQRRGSRVSARIKHAVSRPLARIQRAAAARAVGSWHWSGASLARKPR
jgi:hypothetical protein